MSNYSDGGRIGLAARKNRTKKPVSLLARRLGFESLEHRQLLSVATPTLVTFQPQAGQGTTAITSANNSSTSKELTFLVSGVTAGDTVKVYADGSSTAIATSASPVPSGATTIQVTTNGTTKLSDGTHTFTATQTDTSSAVSASSPASAPVQVFTSLAMTSARAESATVGQAFTYTVLSNAPSGDTVTVTPGTTLPTGMLFNATTHVFTWTPTADQVGATQSFTATLTDTADNSTTALPVFVEVSATSGLSVLAPPASVAIGSPVLIPMNSANSGTPTFSVTTSDSSKLTATLMPQTNQVLKIVTDQGEMDIQLLNNYTPNTVSHFVGLIDANTYATNATFYRIIQSFMIQGGSGGTGKTIPVELNADLRFTSSGLLAMANNGVDGNSSEFFITSPNDTNNGFLDFRYTVFGKLIKGENVREAIANAAVVANGSGEVSQPVTAPKILSMSVTTDTHNGVFMLKAAAGATGPYTVNVSDGLGGTKSFTINVGTNSFDPSNPWVAPINGTDTIHAAANTPVTFTPQGVSANGSAVQVNVQLFRAVQGSGYAGYYVDNSYTGTTPAADTTNPNMTLVKNGSSYTVTPTAGYYGVQVLEVTGQSATAAPWDAGSGVDPVYRAFVPVYVAPPAPQISSISVGGQPVSGSTFANTANQFTFNISGAISGATVSVYIDAVVTPIATGTVASGATTISLTTTSTTKLSDGNRQFTVKQTVPTPDLSLFANFSTSTGQPESRFPIAASSVDSAASAGTALTIGLQVLAPPISNAQVGVLYTYVVQTNSPSGNTVTVTPGALPAGMLFDGVKTFTWTPTSAQLNTAPTFSAQVSDSQGRTASIGPVNISVIIGLAPIQVPVNSANGGNVTVSFFGGQVQVYDNIAKKVLSKTTFKSTDTVSVNLPAGQANSVSVVLPGSNGTAIPKQVLVQGVFGSTNNQVTLVGTNAANTFTLAGDTVTGNGLGVKIAAVQKLTLAGGSGNDTYNLNAGITPTSIVDTSGYNTLDFSQDTGGVTVNLGLDKGQAQQIAPWNTTLSINGIINKLVGSAYADVLTGGRAAMTMIRGGLGNDTITGGSGDNILMGVGGNDTIIGGPGKNLMIAGTGNCSLYAKGRENMIFGGTTNFDTNEQALINLLNQGSQFMYSASYRRAVAAAAANPKLRSSLLTFTDNGARNTIFGSGGSNWFLPGKNGTLKR